MKVVFTKRAQNSFRKIENYIESRWGNFVAAAFEQKVVDFIELLENYPEIGNLEQVESKIYAFRLSKQTTVFYRIKAEIIIVLIFFDTRQNPTKRPK